MALTVSNYDDLLLQYNWTGEVGTQLPTTDIWNATGLDADTLLANNNLIAV